jgi:hypothetical protein
LYKKKFKLLFFLLSIIIVGGYFLINSVFGEAEKFGNLKKLFGNEQKQLIKTYFFPYRKISEQKKQLDFFKPLSAEIELLIKEKGSDLKIIAQSEIKLSNKKNLKKYKINKGFLHGITNINPGSGYIDFHQNNIFIASSRGILAFKKNINDDKIDFKQIKNNINDFIGLKQFKKSQTNSIKDLLIYKDKIYISYTDEIKQDCWNTSIIFGNINFENIKFEKFFTSQKCINSINTIDNELFNSMSGGGRMVPFDNNHILFSIGDYLHSYLAQDIENDNGKIIKININNYNHKIISIGHRNPQGLYFDDENNFVISTEHGPMGGDEINLIEVDQINTNKILNYGWPISSYGEHYVGNQEKYKKYPLHKSHSKYGFIEPLTYFTPSIGISEIVKIGKNKYVASSLKYKSLYFFELNNKKTMINLKKTQVFERVRDLKFYNDKLYLFMEDSASIGIVYLN